MPKKTIFEDSDLEDEDTAPVAEDLAESESDNDLVNESDDDSDAAPDDVTFSQSKASALQKVKDVLTTIGKEKEKQKQKRKLKDDQYKEQKKQKLEELSKNRLPDDFLQNISSFAPVLEKESDTSPDSHLDEGSSEHFDFDDAEVDSEGEADKDDYLPLGNTNIKAVYVGDQIIKSRSAVEGAKAFREKLLYGGKIRRQSERARQSLLVKRKARLC